ncbi:uncharacterized protein LOC100679073 isoform X2 [Nasonia vitripennis]|uniref:Uncharacterized protein n=1 Tax=Nasonia vitripennis TaxID=7425 RepID=A0A7M7QQU2_NASVI|nr:uncharacterized protein LOC100679073 isoform X2 [Nasonia vitripennis]XP_032453213.1 uncharacterized protein LOC100679073 isoform X2 [Nasonia vitripennis]
MFKEPSSVASSGSRKGDEVELVSRFLAPLCARDETARNLALAAARNTVEGWLGGVGSPNNNCWDSFTSDLESDKVASSKFTVSRCGITNGNANNYQGQQQSSFEGFFPQSVSEGAATIFSRKPSFDANLTPEKYPSGSFDCVDGGKEASAATNLEYNGSSNGTPSHESRLLSYRLKDAETRFGSSSESDRRFFASNEGLNEEAESKQRNGSSRHYTRIKSGRQKQFDEDDELDADTRVYGKSPKFDDDFGNPEFRNRHGRFNEDTSAQYLGSSLEADRVVFNTLDGFLNESKSSSPPERKLSIGQIKRPLSQDEEVPWKSGRVLESPAEVVTPGDVGRMLNLGNALDGPRQAQANKYLSLVSLHLPVILRLSVNCPFQNVRIKCAEIIQMIKDRGLPVPEPSFDGPSAFVPVSEKTT